MVQYKKQLHTEVVLNSSLKNIEQKTNIQTKRNNHRPHGIISILILCFEYQQYK
jgi:hypothetical protein